jgi:hypothetical protein
MELIFKRFMNILTIGITAGIFYGIGDIIANSTYNEFNDYFVLILYYLAIFVINYIFLGTATLWHKNVNKKII